MPRKTYYNQEENAHSDSEDSIHSIDEKVQKFTLDDFLKFPPTRDILEASHYQTFLDTATPELQDLLDEIYDYCEKQISTALRMDYSQRGKGTIIGMIYNHIEKKYNAQIFEYYPELAKPLIIAEKEKKNNNSQL